MWGMLRSTPASFFNLETSMGLLQQVFFHPWPAILGGLAIVLTVILLVRRQRAERLWFLPGVAGLALACVATGVFWSARTTIQGFQAMALTGSAGEGSFAALLAEARSTFFAGPVAAALITATGLLLARHGEDVGSGEGASGSSMASQFKALLGLAALMTVLVVGLAIYDMRFAASLPQQVFGLDGGLDGGAGVIASHLARLTVLAVLGIAGSVAVVALSTGLSSIGVWPHRSLVQWGRALVLLLLLLSVTGVAVTMRQQARFMEGAITGQLD